MSELHETSMGKSWDDPKYKEALLKKGQRRPRAEKAGVDYVRRVLTCSNCERSVYSLGEDPCRCSIWDVGKQRVAA